MKIGICCITYNRINSFKRLLNSLTQADYKGQSPTLLISIDKSDTNIIEDFANSYTWKFGEKKVYTHTKNLGLRKHILECGNRIKDYDALIILEDDITVSPFFYDYAIQTIQKYQNDVRIAGISLYNFPLNYQSRLPFNPVRSEYDVFMMNCAQSWGQIWMKEQWISFMKWYEKNNEEFNLSHLPQSLNLWPKSSWLKYHTRYCIEENKFFVYPYESLSTNNNDIGTHVKFQTNNVFQSVLQLFPKTNYKLPNFDECPIKYDGFFEPKFLSKYLNIDDYNLCVNLYGMKPNSLSKKFLLTRDILPFKIIKCFSLKYKPIEANIIWQIEGQDIFLYDTTVKIKKSKQKTNNKIFYDYLYGNSIEKFIHFFGVLGFYRNIICKILHKIRIRQ